MFPFHHWPPQGLREINILQKVRGHFLGSFKNPALSLPHVYFSKLQSWPPSSRVVCALLFMCA